jgi:hypothetical protein
VIADARVICEYKMHTSLAKAFPSKHEVRAVIEQIEGLIGLSSSFPQSRYALRPPAADDHQYRRLYAAIDDFLSDLQSQGIPLHHANPHRTLRAMWGWVWSLSGGASTRIERPRQLYADLLVELAVLADIVAAGADTPDEILRDLRESRRRTNEIFVIMALRSETEVFFERAVQRAAEAIGLSAVRIDREEPEGYITEAILSAIRRSVFVLADLTFERPNCYFEAGYAKGAFRRVVFTCRKDHDLRASMARSPTRVHFDVDAFRITWWEPEKLKLARVELEDRFAKVLKATQSAAD